jgi:phosphate transport system substrate-binding protein
MNMTQKVKVLTLCLMMIALISHGCGKKNEKIVQISGSRTMGPLLTTLAESYQKSHGATIAIQSPGSLKGISSLIEGTCDIAASSVKMPAQQVWEAQKKGLVLKEFIIAHDIITPVVHPSNMLKNLFLGQLSDMYTGLIKDWKNVEGKPGAIIVVDRDDYSGTRLLMNERFFEATTIVAGSIKKKSDIDVISYVAKHPTSVGYVSKRSCDKSVKAININGFSATMENIEKGYYPLHRELYIYVNEKSFAGDVKSFIDFCMDKSGQNLIEKSGFIPVTRMTKPVK